MAAACDGRRVWTRDSLPRKRIERLKLQASVAREEREPQEDFEDEVLIDFRIAHARETLRDAETVLHDMLARLNARPGAGINFSLVLEIVTAERDVEHAWAVLRSLDDRDAGRPVYATGLRSG